MGRDGRVNLLIGTGHFLSHFYVLCLPPLFLAWQKSFDVSYAELGMSVALMSGVTAVLQTPVGFLVDRHGARRFLVGAVGIPLVATILWQSRILNDQVRPEPPHHAGPALSGRQLLMSRPMLLFFGFFLLSSMAGAGIQSWMITVLHQVHGMAVAAASTVLTGYMAGAASGVLIGGYVADRIKRHLTFASVLTVVSAMLILVVAAFALPDAVAVGVMFASGLTLGASRTPRDIMVKDAAPPGQIGKVFGFVSAGLPLGSALTPVPFGFLIDRGHPELVLVLVAVVLLASLFCAGTARASALHRAVPVPAE
jgi:FSR family fosmidomycin resistance protein-like MFS transporter